MRWLFWQITLGFYCFWVMVLNNIVTHWGSVEIFRGFKSDRKPPRLVTGETWDAWCMTDLPQHSAGDWRLNGSFPGTVKATRSRSRPPWWVWWWQSWFTVSVGWISPGTQWRRQHGSTCKTIWNKFENLVWNYKTTLVDRNWRLETKLPRGHETCLLFWIILYNCLSEAKIKLTEDFIQNISSVAVCLCRSSQRVPERLAFLPSMLTSYRFINMGSVNQGRLALFHFSSIY